MVNMIALLVAPALACPTPHIVTATGPTRTYAAAYSSVRTKVSAITYKDKTIVSLAVTGFPKSARGRSFGAHVHQRSCGPDPADAGPHYQNPQAPAGTPLHDKEIWLDLTVRPDGGAADVSVVRWPIAPGAARSVVIHAAPTHPGTGDAGARLNCTNVPFGT